MKQSVVHEAYDSLADSFPDRLAAINSQTGESISFGDLRERSIDLALLLRERNVSACTITSVAVRNIQTLVTYVAISRLTDVSWIPLCSWEEACVAGMTREKWTSHLQYCMQEGNVSFLLVDSEGDIPDLIPILPSNFPVIPLSEALKPRDKKLSLNSVPSSRKFPILKLLSGGTTGIPKLYPISHEMILSELDNYAHVIGASSFTSLMGQPVLQQSCLLWPASCIGQLNIALACQGTAVITRTRDTVLLAAEIDRFDIRIIGGVPSQLSLLAEYIEADSSLTVFSWGEPISEPVITRLLAKPALVVIELLVATEYWLCMYRKFERSDSEISMSREFSIVPSCTISVLDTDVNNVGQLCLSGPMVSGSTIITTNDLVRQTGAGIDFVGRLDFVTKIGGNWFDFRQVENLVTNLDLYPPVSEAAALTVNKIHYLILSVDATQIKQCMYGEWIKQINESVRSVCPVELTVRIVTDPLPRSPATGKLNRKELISIIAQITSRNKPHIACEIAQNRFLDELKSQAKWAGIFALCLRQYALLVPYMYLVLLHCPRNSAGYLPRSRKQSAIVSGCSRTYDFIARSFPFGRAGFLVGITLLASRKKSVRRIVYLWTIAGIALAVKGKRALSWPVAFWTSIGGETRNDCQPWLTESKWRYFFNDLKFLFLSIPDSFTDTQFSEKKIRKSDSSDQMHESPEITGQQPEAADLLSVPTTRGNSIDDEETTLVEEPSRVERTSTPPISEDTIVNDWWTKSPVEYIGVHNEHVPEESSVLSPPTRSPPPLEVSTSVPSMDSMEGFLLDSVSRVVNPNLRPVTLSTALLSLSSLQVTELVQRIRVRVKTVSARDIMESVTVGDLIKKLNTRAASSYPQAAAVSTTRTSTTDPRHVRIQFSPGQIGRVCRWMIKSRENFDRDRLKTALESLVARHPLLRAEIVEPKSFLSFIYDGAVLVVNARRFFSSHPTASAVIPWLDLITDCVYDSWMRTVVHPVDGLPSHWDETFSKWTIKVNDYDDFRRKIMNHKKDLEDSWYHRQNPINAVVFALKDTEYLLISIKHSLSDGNSAFPLMDELADLYEEGSSDNLGPAELVDPLPELGKRFKDGLYVVESNPNRVSVRTNVFYSRTVDKLGGGYYRHYLCFEPSMIAVLRRLASDTLNVGFDSLLLSLLIMSLIKTDHTDRETITLYCPLRDGPGESSYIGLLSDWRDLTVHVMPSASLVDVVNDIAYRVRTRDWTPTLSPGNPESLLLNWLAFDGTRRKRVWHPFHLDNITTRWNKMDSRDYDAYATPSGRYRSMSLEQYDRNGQWWLRFDVATALYPPQWMMKYTQNVNQIFSDLVNCPLKPLKDN